MSPRREKPVNTTTRAATPPAELGALMHALTGATERLQATHDALRAEVARLTRELSEATRSWSGRAVSRPWARCRGHRARGAEPAGRHPPVCQDAAR